MHHSNHQGETKTGEDLLEVLHSYTDEHKARHWEGTFAQFLEEILPPAPGLRARTSHEYLWDMLRWYSKKSENGGNSQPGGVFSHELFGIDDALNRVVEYFKAASAGSEVGRRLLLLLGPPSGGKSTLVILLKRGLEEYCQTDEGALYGLADSPIHESPLNLVPHTLRGHFREHYGIDIKGELSPYCRVRLDEGFNGDFMKYPVQRVFISVDLPTNTRHSIGKGLSPSFWKKFYHQPLACVHAQVTNISGTCCVGIRKNRRMGKIHNPAAYSPTNCSESMTH